MLSSIKLSKWINLSRHQVWGTRTICPQLVWPWRFVIVWHSSANCLVNLTNTSRRPITMTDAKGLPVFIDFDVLNAFVCLLMPGDLCVFIGQCKCVCIPCTNVNLWWCLWRSLRCLDWRCLLDLRVRKNSNWIVKCQLCVKIFNKIEVE